MRIAWASPVPPARSGIADYSAEVLPHVARLADVEVFFEGADTVADALTDAGEFPPERAGFILAIAVWLMAAVHGPAGGWVDVARLGAKRTRRALWRVWYEGSRLVEHGLSRLRKPMLRGARYAGRMARRLGGKQA